MNIKSNQTSYTKKSLVEKKRKDIIHILIMHLYPNYSKSNQKQQQTLHIYMSTCFSTFFHLQQPKHNFNLSRSRHRHNMSIIASHAPAF